MERQGGALASSRDDLQNAVTNMTDAGDPGDPADIGHFVTRRPVAADETAAASRRWWDDEAAAYLDEHGDFLGDTQFTWCPEGLTEESTPLLGDVRGRRVLEVGCGAAQCSRWLTAHGAQSVGLDLSAGMLATARALDARTGIASPLLQADATRLPLADESVDIACSAFGAVPFVSNSAAVMREVARVLRPGGRWAFSVSHPSRWSFPDDPGPVGLVARDSYFDRRPYVEQNDAGVATYVEHHRTLGDRIREIVAAGLTVIDVIEPEWPQDLEAVWGQWGPVRGRLLPGTAIFVCDKPGRAGPAG